MQKLESLINGYFTFHYGVGFVHLSGTFVKWNTTQQKRWRGVESGVAVAILRFSKYKDVFRRVGLFVMGKG